MIAGDHHDRRPGVADHLPKGPGRPGHLPVRAEVAVEEQDVANRRLPITPPYVIEERCEHGQVVRSQLIARTPGQVEYTEGGVRNHHLRWPLARETNPGHRDADQDDPGEPPDPAFHPPVSRTATP